MRRLLWLPLLALSVTLIPNPPPATPQIPTKPAAPRLDHYGDPLPDHALLRIGTTRLRPGGVVTAMAFTKDGKCLVTVNPTTGGQTWEVATGKKLHAFGRPVSIKPAWGWNAKALCALSADGSLAAIVEAEDNCRVYDTMTGKEAYRVKIPSSGSWQPCLSPDNKCLAFSDAKGGICLWDTAKKPPELRWAAAPKEEGDYKALAFSPDSKTLIVGSSTSSITLWDTAIGKSKRTLPFEGSHSDGDPDWITASPDGKKLISLKCNWAWAFVGDSVNGTGVDMFHHGGNFGSAVFAAIFSSDGKSIISAGTDDSTNRITIWEPATKERVRSLCSPWARTVAMAPSPDGKLLAAGDDDGAIRFWDLTSGKQWRPTEGHDGPRVVAHFTSDGKKIISGGAERIPASWPRDETCPLVRLWDSSTGKGLREIPYTPYWHISVSGNGNVLALNEHGKVTLQNIVGEMVLQEGSQEIPEGNLGLFLSRNGRYIATASSSKDRRILAAIEVWDNATTQLVLSIQVKDATEFEVRFTTDNKHFLLQTLGIAEEKRRLAFWDLRTGRQISRPLPFFDNMGTVCFSSTDRSPMPTPIGEAWTSWKSIWGKVTVPGEKAGTKSRSSAMSFETSTTAMGTDEGHIYLWNINSEKPIAKLIGHRGPVTSVSFSPDGGRLVSGSDDSTILVWDVLPWTGPAASLHIPLGKGGNKLWSSLAGDNADSAFSSAHRFLQSPKDAVVYLRQKLKVIPPPKDLAKVIAELDSPKYAERQQAMAKLEKLGLQAQPALQKVLEGKPTLEVRNRVQLLLAKVENQPFPPELLQTLRALEILEMLGTPDAVELLESLSRGDPDAWLTEEAAWALKRVRKRIQP